MATKTASTKKKRVTKKKRATRKTNINKKVTEVKRDLNQAFLAQLEEFAESQQSFDEQDTRVEDGKVLDTLQKIEFYESNPLGATKKPPKGYAAPRFDVYAQERFFKKLSETGILALACAYTPVTRKTISLWRKKSKLFDQLYHAALEEYADKVESEVNRRALNGIKRPVFQKGFLVGHERVYSDRLLELVVKRHKAAFRDKLDIDANVQGGVLVVPATAKTQEEWEERYGNLQRPKSQASQEEDKKEKDRKTTRG